MLIGYCQPEIINKKRRGIKCAEYKKEVLDCGRKLRECAKRI